LIKLKTLTSERDSEMSFSPFYNYQRIDFLEKEIFKYKGKMKSKYFGYTLRGAGTPYQQWILSELPVTSNGIYATTTTSEISAGSKIPMQGMALNQIGGKINADGSISLPPGLYKVEYTGILSTTAASPLKIDVMLGSNVVSEVQGYTSTMSSSLFTDTISGTAIVKGQGCGGCLTLSVVNSSAVSVTPILVGESSFKVIVTRLL
jgi:hypothetical protein